MNRQNDTLCAIGAPVNLTVNEAMDRLRIGRTTVYALLAEGRLRHFRIGRRILVPVSAIIEIESKGGAW